MSQIQLVCNACGQNFDGIVEHVAADDLEWTFFACPHCARAYAISCTDNALRDRIEHIRIMRQRLTRDRESGSAAASQAAMRSYQEGMEALCEEIRSACARERELMDEYPLPRA